MPEVGIETALDRIETAFKEYPELKARVLESLGKDLEGEMLSQMASSGLHAQGGRLRNWQSYHVGSGKGYVAVRPIGSKEGAATGPNGPGAITNYSEAGHAVRRPRSKRKSRAKMLAAPGRHFYAATAAVAEAAGERRVRELVAEFVKRLEGSQ